MTLFASFISLFILALCSRYLSLTALTSLFGPMSLSLFAMDSSWALGICAASGLDWTAEENCFCTEAVSAKKA